MTSTNLTIQVCPSEERKSALRLLYRRFSRRDAAELAESLLAESKSGRIDLSGLFIARHASGRILAAILTQKLGGKAVAIWAPEVAATWKRGGIAAQLVAGVLNDLRAMGFLMVQSLVEKSAPGRESEDLSRGGMPRITDLIYLERSTTPPLLVGESLARIHWDYYTQENSDAFRRAIDESYIGSLDMPELQGLRGLDEIIAGHENDGRFDPFYWKIGRLEGESEASSVLLLASLPELNAWEVSYLGLAPRVRGRGLGCVLLNEALTLVRPFTDKLQLAVDSRNGPALKLYKAAGFEPFDRRWVHFAALGPLMGAHI
jgi:mycothiol synthase